ncbi:MAG: hypothetical protein BGN85_09690, partial [Alphaproteobacteria bacterium 64-11]
MWRPGLCCILSKKGNQTMWGYGHWMHGGMGWPMLVGGGIWLLVLVAVAMLLWLALRPREGGRDSQARELLDARYARGEIGRD